MWFEIILLIFCVLVLYYLRNGAIFVPTERKTVDQMVRLTRVKPGMRVADLGSGDGRIVVALAEAGATAVGFENNPILFIWSYLKIRRLHLPNASVQLKSFWSTDLSDFDTVIVFGMTHIMVRLQQKLTAELRPGTLVISHIFKFPDWQPIVEEAGLRIYKIS